ncbi:hypothetical protein AgCh_038749 [Apium graveolens]
MNAPLSIEYMDFMMNVSDDSMLNYGKPLLTVSTVFLWLLLLMIRYYAYPSNDVKGWGLNDRGVSFTFGPDKMSEFLAKHDLDLVCRAHQVVEDGYEFFTERQLALIGGGSGYDYKSVRRWTTQKKLEYSLIECEKIFVPIHKEAHWCLAVINRKYEKFQYLDSLKGGDRQVMKVLAIKPTVLIGTSGQGKTFTKEVVEAMASFNKKPLIMALSNPTSQAECTAEEAYNWSEGRSVFASGSPFDPVKYNDQLFIPGQEEAAEAYDIAAMVPTILTGLLSHSSKRSLQLLCTTRTLITKGSGVNKKYQMSILPPKAIKDFTNFN